MGAHMHATFEAVGIDAVVDASVPEMDIVTVVEIERTVVSIDSCLHIAYAYVMVMAAAAADEVLHDSNRVDGAGAGDDVDEDEMV